MATPRRSARLRGNSSTPTTEITKPTPSKTPRLSSLTERDEPTATKSPSYPNLESAAGNSSKPSTPSSTAAVAELKSAMKTTPKTAGRPRPGHAEMHPSKVQQSTKKLSNSALRSGSRVSFGLDGAQDDMHNTPTRSKGGLSSQVASPKLDYPFDAEDSQLSADARKLMEKVREEAARIKAQMILGKNEQDRKDGEAEKLLGGRKIAQAKGKANRFSQAHMAEFKKMDSIEGHASSYRCQPGRVPTPVKSLKRSNSKACLDEPGGSTPKSKRMPNREDGNSANHTTKRPKKTETDDTSTRRPVSRDGPSTMDSRSNNTKPKHRLPAATRTPTRPARFTSASVKNPKTTSIPSLTRSPSGKHIAAPQTPKTEFNPKMKSSIPTIGNLKSILRRHQPLFSDDPMKIAAGTHIASPQFEFNKNLLRASDTPSGKPGFTTPSVRKHVDFTSSTKSNNEHVDTSPSPSKNPAPASVSYPSLPALYPSLSSPSSPAEARKKATPKSAMKSATKNLSAPSVRRVPNSETSPGPKAIPSVPHGITNKKRRRDQVNDQDDTENKTPAAAATPDGRDRKRVKGNPPPVPAKVATPSPIKMRPLSNVTPRRGTPSRTPGSARQRDRGKGVLSMSRLNMLSKPKERR
ncbi:hypothetical protein FQN54_003677 [Arachnomyces sp. PD_36]|nr:hypothetical protein FQN54_003677 [Arachnomyces sp. PD_36]